MELRTIPQGEAAVGQRPQAPSHTCRLEFSTQKAVPAPVGLSTSPDTIVRYAQEAPCISHESLMSRDHAQVQLPVESGRFLFQRPEQYPKVQHRARLAGRTPALSTVTQTLAQEQCSLPERRRWRHLPHHPAAAYGPLFCPDWVWSCKHTPPGPPFVGTTENVARAVHTCVSGKV